MITDGKDSDSNGATNKDDNGGGGGGGGGGDVGEDDDGTEHVLFLHLARHSGRSRSRKRWESQLSNRPTQAAGIYLFKIVLLKHRIINLIRIYIEQPNVFDSADCLFTVTFFFLPQ